MAAAVLAGTVLAGSPPAAAAVEIPPPEPIYRVRVAVRTTAPEARLRLRGEADLIQGRVASSRGVNRAWWGGFGRGPLTVSRRPGARRGGATFVVALTPGDGGLLRFVAGNSGPGTTAIRLTNANTDTTTPLRTVAHAGAGRERFTVPVAAVAEGGPVPRTDPLPPKALAFYYPWYEPSDWSGGEPIAPTNAIETPYWSGDPATIDRHIAQAQAAGLDGFVVSWWGREVPWDANTKALVERIPPGFTFALYLETFSTYFGTESGLIDQLDYALDTYASSDRYLRIDGRPVVYAFSTHNVLTPVDAPGKTPGYEEIWRRVRAALALRGHDPVLIGEGRPFTVSDFEVFDGMHVYGTQDPAETARLDREMALTARAWAAIHGGPRRIWAASVIPGYDDRHIPGRKPDYFPREDGRLYEAQWNAAIESHSDQTLVVSFNEWMETTNIEPNLEWGTRYLDLSAILADRFRTSR